MVVPNKRILKISLNVSIITVYVFKNKMGWEVTILDSPPTTGLKGKMLYDYGVFAGKI